VYRWFCRLGLDGGVPDHSTFSDRHGRFWQSDLLWRPFETVLRRCISEDLVGGEGFAVDVSRIKADANRQKGYRRREGASAGRAVKEYLAVFDDAAFGAAGEVTPKFISPADPAARWTGAHGGQAFLAYSTNYQIDVENAIIVDVEATTAIRQAEVFAARRMIERSMERFDLFPARLTGDSAYGSADMLGWLVHKHGIEPHVTVFDKSARKDGTSSRDDFTYDHERDIYFCPGGKTLTTTGTLVNDDATMLFSLGDGRNGPSELPLQAGGNPNNRCARPALRGGVDTPRRGSGIVAIGGDRASAGAEIVVGIGPVEGRCHVGVPGQVVGILVLPGRRQHVRLVLRRTTVREAVGENDGAVVVLAWIAGRSERMRPAKMQTVLWGQFLAHDQPGAVTRSLILEFQIRRDGAMHIFSNNTNRGLGREFIHNAELASIFVPSVLRA
jgi:hypothetical protein